MIFSFELTQNLILLKDNHTLSGNPPRFQIGEANLINDNDWQNEMPFKQRILIYIALLTLMVKYIYGI
jgi:hypothetical protein